MNPIYLDHNATTPLDPLVRAEMESVGDAYGNPSSLHSFGQEARAILDRARERAARLIGAQPDEILFTGGGTESDNLAIFGAVASFHSGARRQVVTSTIEHQAVLNPCRHLEKQGHSVAYLPVNAEGVVQIGDLDRIFSGDTALVSVMLANNDVGTIQPVAEIARRAKSRGALTHSDAVQAVGKIPVDVKTLGLDLLSFSAHKLNGPKGVGALYMRKGVKLEPRLFGGHQEKGLRPGTENVFGIAGFGKACELAAQRSEEDTRNLTALRTFLEEEISRLVPGALLHGAGAPRLPNTANFAFEGLEGEALAINLDLLGVAVSTGSACSAADKEPSHVLLAMGRSPVEARSVIRFSLGRSNRREEIAEAVDRLRRAVEIMRGSRK